MALNSEGYSNFEQALGCLSGELVDSFDYKTDKENPVHSPFKISSFVFGV
jgi:hypothetical protein